MYKVSIMSVNVSRRTVLRTESLEKAKRWFYDLISNDNPYLAPGDAIVQIFDTKKKAKDGGIIFSHEFKLKKYRIYFSTEDGRGSSILVKAYHKADAAYHAQRTTEVNGVLIKEMLSIEEERGASPKDLWSEGCIVGGVKITPSMLQTINRLIMIDNGKNIVNACNYPEIPDNLTDDQYYNISEELEEILNSDSGDAEYQAIKNVLDNYECSATKL